MGTNKRCQKKTGTKKNRQMAIKSFFGLLLVIFGLGTWFFLFPDFPRLFKTQDPDDQVTKILNSLMLAPEVFLPDNNEIQISKTQKSCQYFTCFDVYRCGGRKLLVHIPEPKKILIRGRKNSEPAKEISPMTKEFVDILEAIVQSGFYTENPSEACLFVPPFNLLNEANLNDPVVSAQALSLMPEWNGGKNKLLISMITGQSDNLKIEHGSSLVAAAGLSTFSYRTRFDIALPFYTILQEKLVKKVKVKNYLLTITQGGDLHDKFNAILTNNWNINKKDVVIYHNNYANDEAIKQDQYQQLVETNDVLAQSKFCLVAKEKHGRLTSSTLMASLHAGCIAIILIDNLVLPFSEVLDWKRFSIRFYEHDSELIYNHVMTQISQRGAKEMRNQIKFVCQAYFKDLPTITKTALQIINDRVFSQHAKTYRDWNLENDIQSPLFMKNIPPAEDGFTAVILTYDRLSSLYQVIKSVAETPSLAKILVIWNNQNIEPPPMSEFPAVSKPIKIIRTKANLLTNRFHPYNDINTDAVLSMDDDIVMLTSDELEFAYQVWREFPDRLVGFPSRTHVWNNLTKQWKYESEWTNDVSMVLTGAAFYHKYWHYKFTSDPNKEGKEIKSWLDQRMNCEDIAMNFLIANATGKAPIKVTPRKKFKCSTPQCNNENMLSSYQTHLIERSECINYLVDKYGYMPLVKAEFRADPVLFKDKFPEKLKNFVNIGTL